MVRQAHHERLSLHSPCFTLPLVIGAKTSHKIIIFYKISVGCRQTGFSIRFEMAVQDYLPYFLLFV